MQILRIDSHINDKKNCDVSKRLVIDLKNREFEKSRIREYLR